MDFKCGPTNGSKYVPKQFDELIPKMSKWAKSDHGIAIYGQKTILGKKRPSLYWRRYGCMLDLKFGPEWVQSTQN